MLSAAARQKKVIEVIYDKGNVEVSDLCKWFNISEMTARRDLAILDEKGIIRRVHGGATTNLGRSYEPPFLLRSSANIENKNRIARRAAEIIQSGSSIALDSGTTVLETVKHFRDKRNLTIVTSCLITASEVIKNFAVGSDIRLIISGGIVRANELSLVGSFPQTVYSNLHVDVAFLGTGGVHSEEGLTEFNLEDAEVKQSIIRCAKRRIVLADSSKFGVIALNHIAPLEKIDTIITDKQVALDMVDAIRNKGIEVIIC